MFGKINRRGRRNPSSVVFGIYNEYVHQIRFDDKAKEEFYKRLDIAIVKNFREWVEPRLLARTITLDRVDALIFDQPFANDLLWSLADIWALTYKGPVTTLSNIAKNTQNVHVREVEKNTSDGVYILGSIDVPSGQKTLLEINTAFRELFSIELDKNRFPRVASETEAAILKVVANIKDWGRRASVIKKGENVFRNTLRGVWAKIKTFNEDIREELIRRLWEESVESLGLCADGHVGRLVNVFVGFDDDFKSKISPMEYFRNGIAKIAENALSPMDFKIEQATKLMDEIEMPLAERADWFEALA